MNKIYWLQCKKFTENQNSIILPRSNRKTMISAHFLVWTSKKANLLKSEKQKDF